MRNALNLTPARLAKGASVHDAEPCDGLGRYFQIGCMAGRVAPDVAAAVREHGGTPICTLPAFYDSFRECAEQSIGEPPDVLDWYVFAACVLRCL